jgi:hypothetical protein
VQSPAALPDGGSEGMVLTKASSSDYDTMWSAVPGPTGYTVTTATFTPSLSQANYYFRCTNAAGCFVTIPNDADIDFPLWTELTFRQCSGAQVEFDQTTDSSVTFNITEFFMAATQDEGSVVVVKKVGDDEWDMFGRLASYDSDTA